MSAVECKSCGNEFEDGFGVVALVLLRGKVLVLCQVYSRKKKGCL